MGFYGNITNTSRTQFSFDKIYPNKYELFSNAKTDGIYVGRYVLVEYDLDAGADAYPSTLYRYGENMYTTTEVVKDNNDNDFILPPVETNKVDTLTILNGSNITDKTIVRILPLHAFSNINYTRVFIEITDVNYGTDANTNVVSFNYKGISEVEYDSWISEIFGNDIYHIAENFTASDFESGYYYIPGEEEDEEDFIPAWNYDPNTTYYVKGYGTKIYITSDNSGFYLILYTGNSRVPQIGDKFIVRAGCFYYLNKEEELWYANVTNEVNEETGVITTSLSWNLITSLSGSNYYKNFNIDKVAYPTAGRGYDSTVWQKVYASGDQYYIMIAELNTIVPNFDISSEAPSMVPILPHFDSDTTNIYYKLLIQPQWGFRTKAANSGLLGDIINHNGLPSGFSSNLLRRDEINYPSDVSIIWKNNFYDKVNNELVEKYYNPNTGLWESYNEETNYRLKSAIYFNKNGFNPEEISYSADIKDSDRPGYSEAIATSGWENENTIELAATGYSGHTYSGHNGSSEQRPQIDTQELSIMIPALGDSVALMWDIIYGGRKTNTIIDETNKRNLDIFWEDAGSSILREGLRLVKDTPGEDGFNKTYDNSESDFQGNTISSGEINTLAGCINSVHDLMGMILVNTSEADLKNKQKELQGSSTFKDYKNIDGSKIYYFSNDGTYRRKHETYEFTEVQYTYEPVELTEGSFIKNFYYYSEDNGETFLPSYDDDFDEDRSYYLKKMNVEIVENLTFVPVNNLKAFNSGEKHFPYLKTLSGDFIYDESLYAKDDETVYYSVTTTIDKKMELSGDYEPNKYFYYDDEDYENGNVLKWKLSQDKEASNIQYYQVNPTVFNKNLVEAADMLDDIGIYLYCPNFFYYKRYDLLRTTPRIEDVENYYKEVSPEIETSEEEIYNINGKIYVHLTSEGSNPDYQYDGTNVTWNSDLYEGNIIKNIYLESDSLLLDQNAKMTKEREYYVVFKEEAGESHSYIDDGNGGFIPAISATAYNINKYRVLMKPYFGNRYYRIGDAIITYYNLLTQEIITEEAYLELEDEEQLNYQIIKSISSYDLMTESNAETALTTDYNNQFKTENPKFVDYYTIFADATSAFYGPNRYWYNTYEDKLLDAEDKDAWETEGSVNDRFAYGNWIIDTNKKITEGRRYYLEVQSTPQSGPYYRPNYYYYYDNVLEQYVLDSGASMQIGITYYIKNNFYVLEDKTGRFTKGAIWKYYNTGIPCVIKIASRLSIYEMLELKGFARTFNTIHGLILKINDLLEIDDTLTRDTSTLQGCINTLNDIIYKFDELEFNKLLFTDQTGRIITKDIRDVEVAYGPNYSKKMTIGLLMSRVELLEEKVDNLTFMTDAEMNAIINS